MLAHTQVIITTPYSNMITRSRMSFGKLLCQSVDVIEIAIGLILVLLFQLVMKETIIVKCFLVCLNNRCV
jgi:hypothetical protein